MYTIVIPTLLTIIFSAHSVLYIAYFLKTPPRQPPDSKILRTTDDIRKLLDPPETSPSLLLLQRALPNQRLVRAFGIDRSTFTSSSPEIHRDFRKNAIIRLHLLERPGKFQQLQRVIENAVDFYLPTASAPGDYGNYIQAVVFVTVLAAFFNETSPLPEASSLRFVTGGINTLWLASKVHTFQGNLPILKEINEYLRIWITADPDDPFGDYPLEILLPAYETLWRLVAHAFTYVKGSPAHTLPFLDFFDMPTATQFRKSAGENTASVDNIIQEVLRLHPPTKRIKRALVGTSLVSLLWIHRAFARLGFNNHGVVVDREVAADIEALERSIAWGPSSHEFNALRHKTLTEAQNATLMAFGYGPLKCIAHSVAPRLAGLIIGGLVENDDLVLTRGTSQGSGREGWEGWKVSKRI